MMRPTIVASSFLLFLGILFYLFKIAVVVFEFTSRAAVHAAYDLFDFVIEL
jgi:hypothetical protein